jgi:hypothetical protein
MAHRGGLGINGESGQLQPAHLFIYALAGLMYVGRAILAEHAIPAAEREREQEHVAGEDIKGRFAQVRAGCVRPPTRRWAISLGFG